MIIVLITLILLGYKFNIDLNHNKLEITKVEQDKNNISIREKEDINKKVIDNNQNNEINQNTNTFDKTEIGTTKKDYDDGKKVLANVVNVVDGDTIKVELDNQKYTVRFVGVDTPESVHPNKEKNTKEGKIASDYTKNRLTGKNVYLQKDVSGTDKYRKTSLICIFRRSEKCIMKNY